MDLVQKHLSILGKRVKDHVTKSEGVAVSVCFDLFGCIQVALNPGLDKDGKQKDTFWMDISRLEVIGKKPVMDPPSFVQGQAAEGKHGPAEKPSPSRY